MESVIKTILDGDWNELKKYSEEKTATIIKSKVDDKKIDVLSKMNGVDRTKMEEIINLKNDTENGDI